MADVDVIRLTMWGGITVAISLIAALSYMRWNKKLQG